MTSRILGIAIAACGMLVGQEPAAPPAGAGSFIRGGGPRTFQFVSGEMPMGAPVKGAPYSAEAVTETVQTLADGNRIVNRGSSTIHRDSEGRERRERSLPDGEAGMVVIYDPVAGVHYSLNARDRTAFKMPAPQFGAVPPPPPGGGRAASDVLIYRGGEFPAVPLPPPPSGNGPNVMFFERRVTRPLSGAPASGDAMAPKIEQLGDQYIEGVQATGTRGTITIPAGNVGNEKPIEITDVRWFSQQLQVTVRSEHSDPRMGTTIFALKNISLTEPAVTLFQVPSDYTVKEPQPVTQRLESPVTQ